MRGLRNNNPLNIRHSADRWQGARIAQTDKAFVQFQSMAYGYRAAWKILDTYCLAFKREGKAYNVRNIIGRWAPPTENDAPLEDKDNPIWDEYRDWSPMAYKK